MNITNSEPGFLLALNREMQNEDRNRVTNIWEFLDLVTEVAKLSDTDPLQRHLDLSHQTDLRLGLQILVNRALSYKGKRLEHFEYTLTKGWIGEFELIFAVTRMRYNDQTKPIGYCPRIILEVICERIEGTLQLPEERKPKVLKIIKQVRTTRQKYASAMKSS